MAKVEEEDIPKTLLYRHKVLTKPLAFNSMPPLTKKKCLLSCNGVVCRFGHYVRLFFCFRCRKRLDKDLQKKKRVNNYFDP